MNHLTFGGFKVTFGNDLNVGALGKLGGMDCRALIHLQNPEGLQTSRLAQDLTDNARALVCRLMAVAAQVPSREARTSAMPLSGTMKP